VTVTATASTTPGDYSYALHARGPDVNGYGWGINNSTLNMSVTAPTNTDTTPPVVTITSPANDGDVYTFGSPVSIAFNAVEDMSPITDVSATINGNAFTLSTTSGLVSKPPLPAGR
jgi:hypothetical protein